MAELNPGGAANWANLQAGSFILAQHVLLEDTCCQDLSLPKVTLLIINFTKKKKRREILLFYKNVSFADWFETTTLEFC